MKDTLRQLRRLQADVDALAERVDRATAPDSVDLLIRALRGDQAAADELRALGAAGKCGHVHELVDAIQGPLAASGGSTIADEDLVRPEAW